jgi:FkbM family methyltransferase
MLVRTDDFIGRALAVSGVHEPNVTAAFTAACGVGDVCLDVGAHIGYYTLLAAKLVGPDGHVHAFEPSPGSYERLVANVRLNRLDNVTAHELAVGDERGTVRLYEPDGQNSGLATLSAELATKGGAVPREVDVRLAPISDVVSEADLRRVRVVKVDVEWHELDVLRSLAPVFDLGRPLKVFVEWNPHRSAPEAGDEMRAVWKANGFELYGLGSGHSLERLFPARIEPPVRLEDLPREQTDLLLVR